MFSFLPPTSKHLAVLPISVLLLQGASAQSIGATVGITFEANNVAGFDSFQGSREYPVIDSSFRLMIEGISGEFTALDAKNFSVTDSTPGTGFPFSDAFNDAGGIWTLNDPNVDVNDGSGEQLTLDFLFASDSATNNLITSNILADLVGQSFLFADFQEDPSFPIGEPVANLRYTPPLQSSQLLEIGFTSISFAAGSSPDNVEITINGQVSSNAITGGTSAASPVPEPASILLLAVSSIAGLGIRRRRTYV